MRNFVFFLIGLVGLGCDRFDGAGGAILHSSNPNDYQFPPIIVAKEGESLDHDFAIVNRTNRVVRLLDPSCSCTCTSAILSKTTLNPGESCSLSVKARLPFTYTRFNIGCQIQADDSAHPEWSYRLVGDVFPRVRITPSVIDFGVIGSDPQSEPRNGIRQPSEVWLEIYSPRPGMDAKVELGEPPRGLEVSLQPSGEEEQIAEGVYVSKRRILVEALPEAMGEGVQAATIGVTIDDGLFTSARVAWRKQDVMTMSPSRVLISLTSPDKVMERKTILKSANGVPFRILGVECEDPRLEVAGADDERFPSTSRVEHVLTFRFTDDSEGGSDAPTFHVGSIKFTTDLDGAQERDIAWSLIHSKQPPASNR